MEYKNWKIEKNEVGYYEANKLDNSNKFYLYSKTLEGIKVEIDEEFNN